MGIAKNGYYTTKDINKYTDTRYKIIYGERSPGKSYAVKKECLERAWETGNPTLCLIRRMREDIKTDLVEAYFSDSPIEKITKGEFTCITCFRGGLYWSNIDGEGKIQRGHKCGQIFSLTQDERYKSTEYPYAEHIIFEEFVTKNNYLRDEVFRLMSLVSTIFRERTGTVYMIANTISRVCPYFYEWGLQNIQKQEVGTIDVYTHWIDSENCVKIAVERVESRNKVTGMFFGRHQKAIEGGAWETKDYPHLWEDYKKYNRLFSFTLIHNDFKFTVDLLIINAIMTLYVYPAKNLQKYIITDSYMYGNNVRKNLNKKRKIDVVMQNLFAQGKVCYSDNLTGEDFNNCLNNMVLHPFK